MTDSLDCSWENCTSKGFPDADHLYAHLTSEHIGRKTKGNLCLECKWEGCKVVTTKRDHITSHVRIHIPLKPHMCPLCNKAFKRPQDLKKHNKTHTGERRIKNKHKGVKSQANDGSSLYSPREDQRVGDSPRSISSSDSDNSVETNSTNNSAYKNYRKRGYETQSSDQTSPHSYGLQTPTDNALHNTNSRGFGNLDILNLEDFSKSIKKIRSSENPKNEIDSSFFDSINSLLMLDPRKIDALPESLLDQNSIRDLNEGLMELFPELSDVSLLSTPDLNDTGEIKSRMSDTSSVASESTNINSPSDLNDLLFDTMLQQLQQSPFGHHLKNINANDSMNSDSNKKTTDHFSVGQLNNFQKYTGPTENQATSIPEMNSQLGSFNDNLFDFLNNQYDPPSSRNQNNFEISRNPEMTSASSEYLQNSSLFSEQMDMTSLKPTPFNQNYAGIPSSYQLLDNSRPQKGVERMNLDLDLFTKNPELIDSLAALNDQNNYNPRQNPDTTNTQDQAYIQTTRTSLENSIYGQLLNMCGEVGIMLSPVQREKLKVISGRASVAEIKRLLTENGLCPLLKGDTLSTVDYQPPVENDFSQNQLSGQTPQISSNNLAANGHVVNNSSNHVNSEDIYNNHYNSLLLNPAHTNNLPEPINNTSPIPQLTHESTIGNGFSNSLYFSPNVGKNFSGVSEFGNMFDGSGSVLDDFIELGNSQQSIGNPTYSSLNMNSENVDSLNEALEILNNNTFSSELSFASVEETPAATLNPTILSVNIVRNSSYSQKSSVPFKARPQETSASITNGKEISRSISRFNTNKSIPEKPGNFSELYYTDNVEKKEPECTKEHGGVDKTNNNIEDVPVDLKQKYELEVPSQKDHRKDSSTKMDNPDMVKSLATVLARINILYFQRRFWELERAKSRDSDTLTLEESDSNKTMEKLCNDIKPESDAENTSNEKEVEDNNSFYKSLSERFNKLSL
ncbi:hypothetical protein BB558_005022 [Smittium angustum]|uniref:C2H2-type domain-containing protein n=1 Tax=Smittium angustum TaxID=133377 RepID=A0A2U1J1M7_SMIAN|nr:hypothetical protein BB558_005022 [Smittium angustum]